MQIKDFLISRRKKLGMSQEDLARELTLRGWATTKGSVGHWETGRNLPPLKDINFRKALAMSLSMDVNSMMGNLDFVIIDDDRSTEARRAADIVDSLPEDVKSLALDYLEVLKKRYN
jgi:transcriptional regulator with XRE-family HTH domain